MTQPIRLWMMVAVCAAGFGASVAHGAEHPRTLENMERERAMMIDAMLSPSLAPDERHALIADGQRRLVDLERMVLRDRSIVGHRSARVRQAFADYDLSFLVHASVEKRRHVTDHWLSELGISTETLEAARRGRRQ